MHEVGPLAAEARPVRNRGHRVKHDSRMLDRPQRPVYRCPGASTRTRFGGRLVSALIALRPGLPGLGTLPSPAARTPRRRIRGTPKSYARQRNCTAGARRAPVRPEPMTTRYLADRRASGLGVEVHGGRAYRRLMVACETPLEHLSYAGSDDSGSSRRRHCPVKGGTDNGN